MCCVGDDTLPDLRPSLSGIANVADRRTRSDADIAGHPNSFGHTWLIHDPKAYRTIIYSAASVITSNNWCQIENNFVDKQKRYDRLRGLLVLRDSSQKRCHICDFVAQHYRMIKIASLSWHVAWLFKVAQLYFEYGTFCSSSSDSLLCTSIAPSLFHSRLKTYLFHKSYPP